MKVRAILIFIGAVVLAAGPQKQLKVHISWGHEVPRLSRFYIKLVPATPGVEVQHPAGNSLEPEEGLRDDAWQTMAGAGDVDGVDFTLAYPEQAASRLQNLHIIWADLIAASDADTARRLENDPAFEPDAPKLTVFTNPDSTAGFTVSVGQLLAEKALWIPSLHIYLTAGEQPVPFAEYQKQLAKWKGQRVLEQVERQPEANYAQYTARWEDMGNPAYANPQQRGPGHIVCLTWDSALYKFGIDRGAGVWNDYGNPDHFQFWFDFGDLAKGITHTWKGQRLAGGLPVIATDFEDGGLRYEVEEFAYPLHGPPGERRGDIPMVLLAKVRLKNLAGETRRIPVTMSHRRQLSPYGDDTIFLEKQNGSILFRERGEHKVLFSIQEAGSDVEWSGTHDYQREMKRINATVFESLPASGTREFVVKLPSPLVNPEDARTLLDIDYDAARSATVKFWSDSVERGAQFHVPEEAVNDLFRSTLWHALRLPRRHGGPEETTAIDLPYSNFAYSQTGTPWPVNQAVYVDYMLYALRGYHDVAVEELLAQYRNNQEYSGHINGWANWGVYTPGMLYAVAKDYLLSGDRQSLEKLLPASLKALDYCLDEVRKASSGEGPARGLVRGPLNDGTGDGVWAFNQAYLYAGLNLFGRALKEIGDPRAQEAIDAAQALHIAIERGFGAASARSPLVQLRDHTWIPYVPCEAQTYRRLLDVWYPTDVDTGAVHLLRLNALPPNSLMADSLLNDHEDNLYYKGWGIANEPVYNQQGTAYLLRDDPKAAIRTFYSYMASAFSHSVFEPVEHRWTHGQYFGPPSTDGAWFELYRNMLLRETDDDALLLGQATPREWLQDEKRIEVRDAPTYYGKVSFVIESKANSGQITANVVMEARRKPSALFIRLRHPNEKQIRSVTVNGQPWSDFDPVKEWVHIPAPAARTFQVVAEY